MRPKGNTRDFGLTAREAGFLRRLSPPWKIQRYLDSIEYDVAASGCRSPRRVLRERKVQCMDGALFGAAALRLQGHPPLLLDLEAWHDDDHVLAIWRGPAGWGALGRSNYSGLRYRDPIYPTLKTLALSYFESYFNLRRQKSLRRFSAAVPLERFDRRGWMTAEDDLWDIANHLLVVRHFDVIPESATAHLAPVDRRMFAAGLVGRKEK